MKFAEDIHATERINPYFKEHKHLTEIFFPIVQKPLYIDSPSNVMSEVSTHQALVKNDEYNPEVLYIGKDYTPVHNISLYPLIEDIKELGYELSNVLSFNDRYFEINLKSQALDFQINGMDAFGRVKIINSYDSSAAFSISAGAYVQVCSNGLCVGKGIGKETRKHTGDNDDWLEPTLTRFKEVVQKSAGVIAARQWNKDITKDEIQKLFNSATKFLPTTPKKMHHVQELIYDKYLEEEKVYNNPEFALFMAISYYGTHQDNGVTPMYRKKLDEATGIFFN
jgi:hypothetical protein